MLWFQKAEVAELVDALDSGSSGMYVLWGFKSPLRHQHLPNYSCLLLFLVPLK